MFTIGTDTEVSLYDPLANEFISAIDRIPGTKAVPHKTPNGWIQQDNVAVEFNTVPVSSDHPNAKDEWRNNVLSAYNDVKLYAKKIGLEVLIVPQAVYPTRELIHPVARIAGCDPDFCVYTLESANIPPDLSGTNLRTFGGHIHIGHEGGMDNYELSHALVRAFDSTLGLASLVLDVDGSTRRNLYGKAGAFRPKPYGFEYRTLSNFWITSYNYINFVYDVVNHCFDNLEFLSKFDKAKSISNTINVGKSNNPIVKSILDIHGVLNIMEKNNIILEN